MTRDPLPVTRYRGCCQPPAVSSAINIDELPVRCLVHRTLAGTEVAARLVDTPAERYRASFAFIYMVSAESQEHYKQVRRTACCAGRRYAAHRTARA